MTKKQIIQICVQKANLPDIQKSNLAEVFATKMHNYGAIKNHRIHMTKNENNLRTKCVKQKLLQIIQVNVPNFLS